MALLEYGLLEKSIFLKGNDKISMKMLKLEKLCSDAKNHGKVDHHKYKKKSGLYWEKKTFKNTVFAKIVFASHKKSLNILIFPRATTILPGSTTIP